MTRWIAGDLPKDFRDSLNYRRTVEDDRRENAEKRTWLCQYTNIESLYKIISNKTIRFTRVDKVNDISEKDLLEIDNLYLRTYISCFSYDSKESIPLWSIYTKRGSGVRIDFEFLENWDLMRYMKQK